MYDIQHYQPPLRFHCVGGCWDRTQDSRLPDALTTQLNIIHSQLDLLHTQLDLLHTQLYFIHKKLDAYILWHFSKSIASQSPCLPNISTVHLILMVFREDTCCRRTTKFRTFRKRSSWWTYLGSAGLSLIHHLMSGSGCEGSVRQVAVSRSPR